VHSNDIVVFAHSSRSDPSKFLHVTSNSQQQSQVNTKSSNVGTGFTADPEDSEVTVIVEFDELTVVDGTDTKLTFDGRDERRSLEESSGEGFDCSC